MSQSDPMIEERVLQALASSDVPLSHRNIAKISGVNEGEVWASARHLVKQGLAEERQAGHAYVATPEGQRRGSASIVAALDAEMQDGFRAERDAIVAAAADVMDVANSATIVALLGRSGAPMSRQLLATTIGEDLDTVDELAAGLVADGLIEPRMNGLSFTATDKGRRAAADMTDAEMQDLFSSERDAIVASAGALMATDTADLLWFEAAEEDRQRTGLVASLTYDETDAWAPRPCPQKQCAHEEVLLSRAITAAREATGKFARTKSRADGDRAMEATRLVRLLMTALEAKRQTRPGLAAATIIDGKIVGRDKDGSVDAQPIADDETVAEVEALDDSPQKRAKP